jgi:predicted transcriptional regulator
MGSDGRKDAAAELRMRFAMSVRAMRQALGLSQRSVSRQHHLSQTLLSGIEAGTKNLKLSTMAAVATAVGGDVGEMLKRKD